MNTDIFATNRHEIALKGFNTELKLDTNEHRYVCHEWTRATPIE
jgi:hypothetical protein